MLMLNIRNEKIMDQLPLDYKVRMLIGDYSDLLKLLETDRKKWQFLKAL